MTTPTSAKFCANCGCDCADIQRTKDTLGNYFCRPCFDELLARKKRGERIAPPGLRRGADLHLSDFALSGSGTAFDPVPPTVDADDPLARVAVGDPDVARSSPDEPPSLARLTETLAEGIRSWPGFVGGVGVVVGLAITGATLALVIGAMVWPEVGLLRFLIVLAAGAVIGCLALWHVVGGIQTLCRRMVGPLRLRASAMHMMFATLIGAIAVSVFDRNGVTSGLDAAGAWVATVALWAWLALVIVWTMRPDVRRSVEGWQA